MVNSVTFALFTQIDSTLLFCVFIFQLITSVDNLYTQESTVFNPLRAKRPGAGGGATADTKK